MPAGGSARQRDERYGANSMNASPLKLRAISSVGVEVPMTYALGTSRGTISKAPLLLIDVATDEGIGKLLSRCLGYNP